MTGIPWPPAVPGTRFTDVRHLTEVDSTNRLVVDEAVGGAPEGLVVVADAQTAGRGRLGRRWEAPPGANLLVTVLLRPGWAWDAVHRCTTAVSLAAADACRSVAGVAVATKWPNDLVVPGAAGAPDRKVAGILAESVGSAAGGPAAVAVGLGLNVAWAPPDPPAAAAGGAAPAPATSLEHQAGHPVDRVALLRDLLERLDARLGDLAAPGGPGRLDDEHRRRCRTIGQRVVVHVPGGRVEGTAVGITGTGALVVASDDGGRTEVTVGDVVHVRPAG